MGDVSHDSKRFRKALGKLIREQRKLKGISQKELGKYINLSQSKISKIERGELTTDAEAFLKTLDYLKLSTTKFKRLLKEKLNEQSSLTPQKHAA